MAQYKLNKPKFLKELEADPGFAAYCKSAGLLDRTAPVAEEKSSAKSTKKKLEIEGDK